MAFDLNEVTAEELKNNVEGMDEKRAQDIINYRNENGPFDDLEDLKDVPGMSDEMVNKIREAGGIVQSEEQEEQEE